MFLAVCGCTDPGNELPTSRPPPKSRRKSSTIAAARLSNADPEIARKLEELNQLRRSSKSGLANAPIQKKYDDLEAGLNKCKDDLRELQRKSVSATPENLRQKHSDLGKQLSKCGYDLQALHDEAQAADSQSVQKKFEALQYVLVKYRKDIEDELQKCWTQLKLLHLESKSHDGGEEGGDEDGDETSQVETEAESEVRLADILPLALEMNPRKPRCSLLWKPPLPDARKDKSKHYDERKLLSDLSSRKRRLGYKDKPPKYYY